MGLAERYSKQPTLANGSSLADKYANQERFVVAGQEVKTGMPLESYIQPEDTTATVQDFNQYNSAEERNAQLQDAIRKAQIAGDPTVVDPMTGGTASISAIGAEPTYMAMDLYNPLLKVAGAGLSTYGAAKGGKYLFDKAVPVSSELNTAARRIGISPDEALDITKNVPKEDRAFELAKQGGGRVEGEMARALQGADDATRLNYADELALRRQEVADAVGEGDFANIRQATQDEFDTMRKAVARESTNTKYDVSSLRKELQGLATFARNDASENNIKRMANRIEENPTQSLDDLLTLRQEINYEYSKAPSGAGKERFKIMKNNVDNFIRNSGVDDATLNIVDDAIDSYNRMKTQEEFISILNDPSVTKTRALGSKLGEQKAVNWGTLKKKLNDAKLGEDVKDAAMIAKKLSDKYGNVDGEIFSATRTVGQGGVPQTLAGDVQASATVRLIQNVWEMLFHYAPTEKGATRRLQSAIRNSMKKGNTQREFAYELIKNKNTPESIRAAMQRNLDALGVKVDEILPADKSKDLTVIPDVVDTQVIDPLNQIGGQAKKQLTFNPTKDRMLPKNFNIESDVIMPDRNVARPQTREERLFNLKETTRPK